MRRDDVKHRGMQRGQFTGPTPQCFLHSLAFGDVYNRSLNGGLSSVINHVGGYLHPAHFPILPDGTELVARRNRLSDETISYAPEHKRSIVGVHAGIDFIG